MLFQWILEGIFRLVGLRRRAVAPELPRLKTSKGPLSLCVIGGGVSGCSAASYMREMFGDDENVRIDIIEQSGMLGGRIALVDFAGQRYEAGASILHSVNRYASGLAAKHNLPLRRRLTKGITAVFYNGSSAEVTVGGLSSIIGLLLRFGFGTLIRMGTARDAIMAKFVNIYRLLDSGAAFEGVPEMLTAAAGGKRDLVDLTGIPFRGYAAATCPAEWRMSLDLIDNLITGGTRTNYGQAPDTLTAFASLVSMAGTQHAKLFSIAGGNCQLATLAASDSAAKVHLESKAVSVKSRHGKWEVKTLDVGKGEGVYDAVVVAYPLEGGTPSGVLDLSDKVLNARVADFAKRKKLHVTYCTFVRGTLNTNFLSAMGFRDACGKIPGIIMTTRQAAQSGIEFSSIGLQFGVDMSTQECDKYKEDSVGHLPPGVSTRPDAVWKVFSNTPLSEDALSRIFAPPSDGSCWKQHMVAEGGQSSDAVEGRVRQVRWEAYPEYDAEAIQGGELFLPFELGAGLAYTCSIERAASSVEMGMIGGKNAALLVRKHLLDIGVAEVA